MQLYHHQGTHVARALGGALSYRHMRRSRYQRVPTFECYLQCLPPEWTMFNLLASIRPLCRS